MKPMDAAAAPAAVPFVFARSTCLPVTVNLHHVELFYHVAKHGGISRAVRHMPYGIQQPAVSSQILLLEQDLGVKLFERQPFRLTREGRELYDFARPFFENAEAVAARLRAGRAPTLRIAASELVLRDYLPIVIERLQKRHPELRFGLRSGFQPEWLFEGKIDLAITPLETRPPAGLKALSIVKLSLVLLVPRRSRLESAAGLWEKSRIEEPLISPPAGQVITRVFRRGLRHLKLDWPTAIEANSLDLVTQYVANGYGLGVGVELQHRKLPRGVRALPLAGFDPVEIVAMWRPPVSEWHDTLCEEIARRAQELWPR